MTRCTQVFDEVLAMTWTERDGRVTLGDMRIVPVEVYNNVYNKGLQKSRI